MLTREEVIERGVVLSYGGLDDRPDTPFEITAYGKDGRKKAEIKLDKGQCEYLVKMINRHLGNKPE